MLSALNPKYIYRNSRELLKTLINHRQLTMAMAKREITERYAGQIFGLFWVYGHPLVLMLVYVLVFGFIFKLKIGGTRELPFDYTIYLLSGLIPWLSFAEGNLKASTVIIGNSNIVKQVVFPIEVLPVKGVLATITTQIVFSTMFIIYVAVSQGRVHLTYLLLPVLITIQTLGMIGVSFILAAIGAYIRDTKDFVQVFNVIGFYIMPAIYVPGHIPEMMNYVLYLNPFSYMIWTYQDALYYGRFEHPWAWVVFIFMSLFLFVTGYRLFRKLKVMFGSVL